MKFGQVKLDCYDGEISTADFFSKPEPTFEELAMPFFIAYSERPKRDLFWEDLLAVEVGVRTYVSLKKIDEEGKISTHPISRPASRPPRYQ